MTPTAKIHAIQNTLMKSASRRAAPTEQIVAATKVLRAEVVTLAGEQFPLAYRLLEALNIPIWHLSNPDEAVRRIKDAQTLAHAALHPVAVLLSRELMWED